MDMDVTREVSDLAITLRRARLRAGLTQVALAAHLGVRQPTVSQWERGVCAPSLPYLAKIVGVLEVDPAELLGVGAR